MCMGWVPACGRGMDLKTTQGGMKLHLTFSGTLFQGMNAFFDDVQCFLLSLFSATTEGSGTHVCEQIMEK